MTTTVIVQAHCDKERREVKIKTFKTDGDISRIVESRTIQDGEEEQVVVYDDLRIEVSESLKLIPPTKE